MNKKLVRNTLNKAAKIIQKGWRQHFFSNDEGTQFCALGAVKKVRKMRMSTVGEDDEVYQDVQKVLSETIKPKKDQFESDFDVIANWNDEQGRLKSEVVETILKAADSLK